MHTILGDSVEISIWKRDTKLPEFPALNQDLKTDVLIIGGGLAGILCAYRLQQQGVDYALIEADRVCAGVSGNTTAKITSQHGLIYKKLIRQFGEETAKKYWLANEEALHQLKKLCGKADCPVEETNNYIYSTGSEVEIREELAVLKQLGIPARLADGISLPFPVTAALCFEKQAQFDPMMLVNALVKEMHIYEHTPARQFIGNTVLTDKGRITADKIIVATHFPIINKHGAYFLKMYQQRSYVVALENAAQVDGMYLDAAENGLSFRNYGKYLLLGGGGHRTGKHGGGWRLLEDFAAKHYPDAKILCRWAAQDCMTLDGIPYIGQYSPKTPGLYVATGFNKWGMSSSMLSAMILGDLVQGRKNPYSPVFSPSRTILRPQLFANIWESTVNLLTPTKPRCPHLGCALKWNPREHSWDCPCHGSRFAADGKLLNDPATDDLKNV